MPIDPNIALGYRGIEVPNPLAGMAQVTQIQNALQQQRMGGIQMQNALREQARQQELESIMSGLSPTAPVAEQAAALHKRGFFTQAQALTQQAATLSETQRRAEDARLKALTGRLDLMGRFFSEDAVKDQPTYDAARQKAIAAGLDTEEGIPAVYDPAVVARVRSSAMSLKDQIAARQREQEVGARGTSARAAESQAMTAQAKFEWEKANPGFTVQDTDQGLMKVDKRTGAMSPLTMGNQPVMGRTTPQVIQGPEGPMVVQPTTGVARPVMQPAPAPGGTATRVGAPLPESLRAGIEFGNLPPNTQADVERYRRSGAPQPGESAYSQAIGTGLGRQVVADIDAARTASVIANRANSVLQAVDANKAFMGTGADFKLALARALNVTGKGPTEQIAATESLIADLKQSVIDAIKSSNLGTGNGFTDKDLKYLAEAKAGDIAKDPRTLREFARKAYLTSQAAAEKGNRILEGNAQVRQQANVPKYEVPPMFQPNAQIKFLNFEKE